MNGTQAQTNAVSGPQPVGTQRSWRELRLNGLRGDNPLHFLAALGALVVSEDIEHASTWQVLDGADRADEQADQSPSPGKPRQRSFSQRTGPRLRWERVGGVFRPRLLVPVSEVNWCDAVLNWVCDNIDSLSFANEKVPGMPLGRFRGFVEQALGSLQQQPWLMRQLSALATDAVESRDPKTKVEPSPLSFANGGSNQWLLHATRNLASCMTTKGLFDGVLKGRPHHQPIKGTPNWDPSDMRQHALMGKDPADIPKAVFVEANVLAFFGLGAITTVPTTWGVRAVGHTRLHGADAFVWPIWSRWLSSRLIRSVMTLRWEEIETEERVGRGILAVYASGVANPTGRRKFFRPARPI